MPSIHSCSGMRKRATTISATALLAIACYLTSGFAARAADFTGVWATDKAVCNKVFVKKGNGVAFADDADLYGSGLIIEGNKLIGKVATCTIKSTKEDGAVTHMLLICATGIMNDNFQFSLKTIDANKIQRIFPGMPELATYYFRCSL